MRELKCKTLNAVLILWLCIVVPIALICSQTWCVPVLIILVIANEIINGPGIVDKRKGDR